MFKAKVFPEFLSVQECKYIVDVVSKIETWENAGSEFWNNRALNIPYIKKEIDFKVAEIVTKAIDRVQECIFASYDLKEGVYPDLYQVIRWFPGMEQPPHADDMTNTEHKGLEHRAFGAIIYLNDDYLGGHTYYPQHDFKVVPKIGTLAIHPGDPEHLHGVTKIEGSTRYTIASFWGENKNYG